MSASPLSEPPGRPTGPHVAAALAWLLSVHEAAADVGNQLLTPAGVSMLQQLLAPAHPRGPSAPSPDGRRTRHQVLPRWDSRDRRLWLGPVLLKEFRQPAPNQAALLDAFQCSEWGERHVLLPLPREAGESEAEAQERLHETIKSLNRCLPPGTLHFRGDGSGQGTWWEYAVPLGDSPHLWEDLPESDQ